MAANLLIVLILCGGIASLVFMEKEVFPPFKPHQIVISANYPGASPEEIEQSICVRLEQAVFDVPGVKQLKSEIYEGRCDVKVFIRASYDKTLVQNVLNARVQAINHLPKALEKIEVRPYTREEDDGVIWVALHGRTDALTFKRFGEAVQNDLLRLPGVSRAQNYFEVPYEIAIEVSPDKLRQHHLSLKHVADAVQKASVMLPGGVIKTPPGELLLRVNQQAGDGKAIADLVLQTGRDGSRVVLADVANIRDGLEERRAEWHHNGESAQGWEVHAEKNSVAVARLVKDYVAQKQQHLPEGMSVYSWWDDSQAYDERIDTLVEDGCYGFILVFIILALFLQLNVAWWATVGMVISVFGALWLMPLFGVSLNMLSLFFSVLH